ncbi:hypothetical protein Ae201684_002533 [Aphanomyces euteiches]|uniref:Uncharacterized protein n=1 Tax=Aphanomyces euteiches TaxID=100861 RepID=A0A6G0XQ62_9STRA|nr:hypothetical protein Ae201684_002533 [Aphanomyces euteiches]
MHAVWLYSLERELMLAKQDELVRPHTSFSESRPRRHKSKLSASATTLSPLPSRQNQNRDEDAQAKKKKQEENHACWLAWCEQKADKLRQEKQQAASTKKNEMDKTKQSKAPAFSMEACFAEWKRTKRRQQKEQEQAALKQQAYERSLVEKYMAEKRKQIQERQGALARLKAQTPKKKKKRHVVVPPPAAFHKLIPIEYVSPKFQAEMERKLERQLDLHEDEVTHRSNFRDAKRAKETKRFQAQMHSSHAHRADSLDQLRHWATPTREIYVLASLLYKLVALESQSTTRLVDVWRWLPWTLVRTIFQDDLVETLQSMPIVCLAPITLTILYFHCAQPHFSTEEIEARSSVGAAIRLWVNNVAAVHELVDPTTQHVRAIDSLKSAGVSCRDIGTLVLLLHVYPHVNFKLKDQTHYSDKQLRERQVDCDLLRELYAAAAPQPPPPLPPSLDQVEPSQLLGLLDLPTFAPSKTRSKLAARLAARLQERHNDFDESPSSPSHSPRASTPHKSLQDDTVVVYKLSIPSKQQDHELNPLNYIQQKRRDSSLRIQTISTNRRSSLVTANQKIPLATSNNRPTDSRRSEPRPPMLSTTSPSAQTLPVHPELPAASISTPQTSPREEQESSTLLLPKTRECRIDTTSLEGDNTKEVERHHEHGPAVEEEESSKPPLPGFPRAEKAPKDEHEEERQLDNGYAAEEQELSSLLLPETPGAPQVAVNEVGHDGKGDKMYLKDGPNAVVDEGANGDNVEEDVERNDKDGPAVDDGHDTSVDLSHDAFQDMHQDKTPQPSAETESREHEAPEKPNDEDVDDQYAEEEDEDLGHDEEFQDVYDPRSEDEDTHGDGDDGETPLYEDEFDNA